MRNNFFRLKRMGRILLFIFFLCPLIFISCSDDENVVKEEPYFRIEENPTGLSVDINGATENYVVRSNRPWQIVAQSQVDWIRAFPAEGEDDGIFEFIVEGNDTFEPRNANFAFIVDGNEQPVLFRVDQEANVPFIVIEDSESGIGVPSALTDVTINVQSNVNWSYTIVDGSWLTGTDLSESVIKLIAAKNTGEERVAKLTVSSAQYPNLDQEITITQSPGNVILEEGFDWLNYGSTIFYTTTGETRMDSWSTEEMDRGWNSTENVSSSNQKVVYARTGFLKLGKTGYGGDLISPALSALEEPQNLRVTFKAVPYKTKGGTEDDNILNVSVVGPGTTNIGSLTIDNWPDYDSDPECIAIWEDESSNYEFIITGATAETKIKFLGGDYNLVGVGKGKNRIFLDDIKVKIIE
ncbi:MULTISPECIES: BACON domain-containing protein [unclassified Arenibacter]|uniref:BACON domain-containing protein n=1 Tax=unclassified Arenibacter TaxID=2615047 RepID=UPI000E3520E9|nr:MULTISPECIES: BACON domain-containing protein [unclassified Arenibacter]MCM4162333.1 hypothetical protein [Arenibacter sp. A80]RFT57931.1 hypothetical protein D0S24_01865 [Arenibacter sp. P308M17]